MPERRRRRKQRPIYEAFMEQERLSQKKTSLGGLVLSLFFGVVLLVAIYLLWNANQPDKFEESMKRELGVH